MPFPTLLVFVCLALSPWLDMIALAGSDQSGYAAAGPALSLLRRPRGRPRKFAEASRAVTLTLPESVLSALAAIHADIGQAIVQLATRERPRRTRKAADLVAFGQHAVITIRPTPSLELRAGVQLVPLPDGRALIALDEPTSLAALQLSLSDALEDRTMPLVERAVYENLSAILRDARRSNDVTLQQRHIIILETRRARRTSRKGGSTRKAHTRKRRDRKSHKRG